MASFAHADFTSGMSYFDSGDFVQASQLFQKAARTDESIRAKCHLHCGLALQQMHDHQGAEKKILLALECDPSASMKDQLEEVRQWSFPLIFLIVGEAGDGKSSLNNILTESTGAATGKDPSGVTKTLTEYQCKRKIHGKPVIIIDSPGVGDEDVTPAMLLALIEEKLHLGDGGDVQLDGVIVTTPATSDRVKMGAQVVKILVEKGLVGGDEKWKNVVLVGTKADKADEDEFKFFQNKLVPHFFDQTAEKTGPTAFTTKTSAEELWKVLELLPATKVEYTPPGADVLAGSLAAKMGLDKKKFAAELEQQREQLEQAAEQTKQQLLKLQQECQAAQEQQQVQLEEQRERLCKERRQEEDDRQERLRKEEEERTAKIAKKNKERQDKIEKDEKDRQAKIVWAWLRWAGLGLAWALAMGWGGLNLVRGLAEIDWAEVAPNVMASGLGCAWIVMMMQKLSKPGWHLA